MFEGYNDYLAYTKRCAGYVRTHEQQMALLEAYHTHSDRDALDEFVEAQLYWIAQALYKRYRESGFLMDLIQDANVRLLGLVESFDPDKGVKFRTYAEPVLVKEAAVNLMKYTRGRADSLSTYKRSFHYRRIFNAFRDQGLSNQDALWATARVFQKEQRKRDFDELTDSARLATYDLVLALIALTSVDVSIDTPLGDDEDYTFADSLEDVDARGPEAATVAYDNVRLLREAVLTLNERQQFVVVRTEGLFGFSELRAVEIAEILGVSRQRVNAIYLAALDKIKQYLVSKV